MKLRTSTPSNHRGIRRAVAAVVAIGAGLFGMTAASAYFTAAGSGGGSGTAGTMQAMTATATVSGTLLPDGSYHNVTVNITNPNSYAVTLESVTSSGSATGSGGKGTCTVTGVTLSDQTRLSTSLPGDNATTPITFTDAATAGVGSEDGCQGATISIPVTITVQKP